MQSDGGLEREQQLRHLRARGEPFAVSRDDAGHVRRLPLDRDLTWPLEQRAARGWSRIRRVVRRELVLRQRTTDAVGQRASQKRVFFQNHLLAYTFRAQSSKQLGSARAPIAPF